MYHDPQNPDNVRRKRRRRKILLIVLLVLIVAFTAWRLILIHQVNRRIAAIRATGIPITAEELNRWYKTPPPGQNAADIYLQVMAVLRTPGPNESRLPIIGEVELPPRTTPLTPEIKKGIAGYLRQNSQALRLLHQGANLKAARYPVDYSKGMGYVLPLLGHLRYGVKSLLLEGILNAETNHPEQAAQDVIAMLGVARSMENEPNLLFSLVRIGYNAMTVSGLERMVNQTRFADKQLVQMAEALREAEASQGHFRALVGERATGYWIYQHFDWKQFKQWTSAAPPPGRISVFPSSLDFLNRMIEGGRQIVHDCPAFFYKGSGLLDKDFLLYLDWMNQYALAVHLPTDQRYSVALNVGNDRGKLSQSHLLLRFTPALARSILMEVRTLADLRNAITALAVERYRLATGKLPDRLDQLVPKFLTKVPIDPFDLQPLRYKRLAKGYIVYSIGEDQIDNGGREKNAEGRTYQPGTDITFTVEH